MSKHVLNTRLPAGRLATGDGRGTGRRSACWRSEAVARALGLERERRVTPGGSASGARREDQGSPQDEPARAEPGARSAASDQALAELYREESPKLVRILTRKTRSADDAHDLVQDVFFRLARLVGQGAALEKPQAYLRRIASNLLKDRAKTSARRSATLHVVADEESLPGLDQQRLLESRDMLKRVEAAIMRLKPKTREIFVAHRVDGLTYAEIAERTGLSVKGVEKQMSKAIYQLDRMLDRS
jgi:RNA polymerase sigma factor (sigma-70 family)